MESTRTWSTLRQRRRRAGPKFPGRPRHNLIRRQEPAPAAPPAEEEEGEEADGEQEAGGEQEEEEMEEEKEEEEEEEEEVEGANGQEAESDSDAEDQAGASSESESDAAPPGEQPDSSDSEQEQLPPTASQPPPGATPAPPGVQPPPAATSLPPPAAQASSPPEAPPVLNPSRPSNLPANIPPARGFITLVPGAPPPSNPPQPPPQEMPAQQPQPPPGATPSRPPVVEPQDPPPASQTSAPRPPPPPPPPAGEPSSTPPAAETPSTNLPPPAVGNAASGTPRPELLPPTSQVEATSTPISATPAPAEGTDRGFAIGISFAVVAIVALLIGAVIFGLKRYKRKKKVTAVATNMSQNAGGGNAFFPRESAILREPKRNTREVEQAIVATFRQTKIANRTTKEMEEQMIAQFKTERNTMRSQPNPPTAATMTSTPPVPDNNTSNLNTRNMQAESFYYEKSINEPAMPAPLRISTSQRRPDSARVPYPVSTYDMYQEVGQGSLSISDIGLTIQTATINRSRADYQEQRGAQMDVSPLRWDILDERKVSAETSYFGKRNAGKCITHMIITAKIRRHFVGAGINPRCTSQKIE
ncbi:hypothetical protein CI238_00700 [Colletotrichum incanum]|uniref:Uncharacterized protein n=1 Tax=Colletotrichum incanum TaxID=1573173 RepID=A0A166RPP7_COLIC|nr:hypothetical protein CI238_00700 [Colletotrichum incanum]